MKNMSDNANLITLVTNEEWRNLSVISRHKINKFMLAAQRITRKYVFSQSAINDEDMKAIDIILGDDWQDSDNG